MHNRNLNTIDWHPADIKAAIGRRAASLASVGRIYGINRKLVARALDYPHAAGEKAIAAFLNVPAYLIWPSRYHTDGTRKRPQPSENYQRKPRFDKSGLAA